MEKADLGKHCLLLYKPGFTRGRHICVFFIIKFSEAILYSNLVHFFCFELCTAITFCTGSTGASFYIPTAKMTSINSEIYC